ncbi:MAG: short-chain fatty acid transporter [Deltaproteobacteria bacterium]|nr:short-chain fatty acid transporter [Deltaproteobacteria bacterium]
MNAPNKTEVPRIAQVGERMASLAQAYTPDPFVIALLLVAVSFVVGFFRSDNDAVDLAYAFAEGMLHPGLLAFAFKMALILVTGHALACAPFVQRHFSRLASVPKTNAQAAASVAFVAMFLGWWNWGLGLVGGAFFAREIGKSFRQRQIPLQYPLIGAAGYLGLLVWHGGFSGSAPLKVAVQSSFSAPINISRTILSERNLLLTVVVIGAMSALFYILGKGAASKTPHQALQETSPEIGDDVKAKHDTPETKQNFASFVESRRELSLVISLPIFSYLVVSLVDEGASAINLNFVILLFFAQGIVLFKTPRDYSRAFADGAKGAGGILLQFPLYFGILAVTKESGLLSDMAQLLTSLATPLEAVLSPSRVAPALSLLSASMLNVLVPSGGGQWALQSPILLETCERLSLDKASMVMAFSYGDQLTNMMQPFWALPLLSITGLKAHEVMGYTLLAMFTAFPIYLLAVML